jgi:hypothetical protein
MKKVLGFAAAAEAATGLALVVVPSLVVRLLFGVELISVSLSIARVTGMALVGLGIACWPGCGPLYGMLTYSALATLYLAYLGVADGFSGILLWPAMILHAVLTLLLAWAWFQRQEDSPR